MNNMFGQPGGGQMNLPQINPFSYPSEICEECGSEVFIPGVILKKVPGMLLGDGGADFVSVPIKVAVCAKCGTLSPSDKEKYDEETAKAQKVKDMAAKSGLIV